MFHDSKFMYAYFFIGSIIGFFTSAFDKKLIKDLSPFTIILIESSIYLILLLLLLFIMGKMGFIKKDLVNINLTHIGHFTLSSIISIISAIVFLFFLEKQDLGKMQYINYGLDIVITLAGASLFLGEKITLKRSLGLIMVILGLYVAET